MEFTQDDIDDWKRYEKVRKGGKWNMFTPQARRATGLSEERYSFVREYFSELKSIAAMQADAAKNPSC